MTKMETAAFQGLLAFLVNVGMQDTGSPWRPQTPVGKLQTPSNSIWTGCCRPHDPEGAFVQDTEVMPYTSLHTSYSALTRMQTPGSNLRPLVITSVAAPCRIMELLTPRLSSYFLDPVQQPQRLGKVVCDLWKLLPLTEPQCPSAIWGY